MGYCPLYQLRVYFLAAVVLLVLPFTASFEWDGHGEEGWHNEMIYEREGVVSPNDDPQQRSALMDFYYAMNGPLWKDHTNWGSDASYCTWSSLSCGGEDVTAINFIDPNNMTGVLPASLANLYRLQIFVLINNVVQGPFNYSVFPTSLMILKITGVNGGNFTTFPCQQLPALQVIELLSCGLTGSLPPCLAQMNSLDSLVLLNNHLVGHIPTLPLLISNFQVGNNSLSGTLPSFDDYPALRVLNLQSNDFVGTLPPISGLLLENLFLDNNWFNGTIPEKLFSSPNLLYLFIGQNFLTGTVSPHITNLTKLLKFAANTNLLHGTLPPEIGNMTGLIYLSFNNNNLTGTVPETWKNLTNMQELFLYNNNLSGALSTDFFSNMPLLNNLGLNNNLFHGELPLMTPTAQIWYLMYNKFQGTLPSQYGEVGSLLGLSLNNNSLIGTIPSSWGSNWTSLRALYLNNNYLNGSLPANFASLESLQTLDLSLNNLEGEIPPLDRLKTLQTVQLANNHLYGNLGGLYFAQNITELRLSGNKFSCDDIQLKLFVDRLQVIDLNGNSLNCAFDHLIGNMVQVLDEGFLSDVFPQLKVLLLSQTNISGTLPAQLQRFSGLVWLSVSHNSLTGTVDSICNRNQAIIAQSDPALSHLDVSYNNLDGPIDCLGMYNYLSTFWVSGNNFASATQEIPSFMKIADGQPHIHQDNFTCPQLTGKNFQIASDLPSSYYQYSLCECDKGYFGTNGNCWECPKGCECEGDRVWGCYYERSPNSDSLNLLKPCKNVLGNTPCNPNFEEGITAMICAEGYDNSSRYCSMCSPGYYGSGGSCSKCSGTAKAFGSFSVLFFLLVFKSAVGLTDPSTNYVTTLVFHWQVMNSLLQLDLPWPDYYMLLYFLRMFAKGSTYSIYQLQCFLLSENGIFWFSFNFWWYAVSPMLIIVWGILIYCIGYLIKPWRLLRIQDSNNPAQVWLSKCLFMTFVLLVDIIYIISLNTATNLSPEAENNKLYLATAPNVLYTNDNKFKVSAAMFSVMGASLLALVFILTRNNEPEERSFVWYVTKKYASHKITSRWWIIADILKRIFLGVLQGAVAIASINYPLIVALTFMTYSLVLAYTKPYHCNKDTLLEVVSLSVVTFSFFISVLLLHSQNTSIDGKGLTWCIVISNLIFMAGGLIGISIFYVHKWRMTLRKVLSKITCGYCFRDSFDSYAYGSVQREGNMSAKHISVSDITPLMAKRGSVLF